MGKLSQKEKENALNEVRILASIEHENIIQYKECFFDDASQCLCLIMELCTGGDILQRIEGFKKNRGNFPEHQLWIYLVQLIQGLKTLHDNDIVHRDIKCANLFVMNTPDGDCIKLGDLNVSKVAKGAMLQTQTGTPYYASPEVWKDLPYNAKSDIWSAGCVLYEMAALKPPFTATDMQQLYQKVIRGNFSRVPSGYSQDFQDVIKYMLRVDPTDRPTCTQILKLPQVQKYLPEHLKQQVRQMPLQAPKANMLSTIRIAPGQLKGIQKKLPKPNYDRSALSSRASTTNKENQSMRRNQSLPSVPANPQDRKSECLNKFEEQKENAQSYLERYERAERKKQQRALSRHEVNNVPTTNVRSGDQVSLSARYNRAAINQSANNSHKPQNVPLRDRALEYNQRHHPASPRMSSGQGSIALPPIDMKHLRKGEAILNRELSKNGEAIMKNGRQHNASQATLEQRLNSRASSNNRRYGVVDGENVGGAYQRKYGVETNHQAHQGSQQAYALPPRPQRYNSIQQPIPDRQDRQYMHHAKQNGYRYN